MTRSATITGRSAAFAALLALAACTQAGLQPVTTTTQTGKAAVSAAAAGADLVQVANEAALVQALAPVAGIPIPAATSAELSTGLAALRTAGQTLEAGTAVSGDLQADITLTADAIQVIEAGYASAGPTQAAQAAKAAALQQAFVTLVGAYDADAQAQGLPTVTLPAAVAAP